MVFTSILLIGFLIVYFFLLRKKNLLYELTAFSNHKLSIFHKQILLLISLLIFISFWSLISSSNEPKGINIVPSPFQVFNAFGKLIFSGKLLVESWVSFSRILIGFSFASITGITLGLLAGTFFAINKFVVPLNSFLRYIPPTAFISLLIVYFGIGEIYKYSVIFFGVIFFIIQMVIDVVDDLDKKYLEMGLTSGFSNWKIFTKIIIPYSIPRIIDVLRINLSAAWTFLVAAEIVGAEKGLGHLISISQRYLRMDELFVGILTFGIIGIITDLLIQFFSKKYLKWYYISINR